MGKALADIGNRSLEPAPVTDWANSEHFAAMAASIPGKPDCAGAPIKPCRYEPMPPQARATFGAYLVSGPLILMPKLNETLDCNAHEQYHWSALCGVSPLCSGVKGVAITLYPISHPSNPPASTSRYKLNSSHFQSRHREQNYRLWVMAFCKTTIVF
jgi:hypothetical protein